MEFILKMEHTRKRFGDTLALDDVCFDLLKGEVHALTGENGAGKSTLIKILAGALKANGGDIYAYGERVKIDNVKDSQELGIRIIYQELNLVPTMSVAENIYLGCMPSNALGFVDDSVMETQAQVLLDQFALDNINPKDKVSTLTIAEQQMIEILKALSSECKILIMDEPTAALTDKEIAILFNVIKELKDNGVAILYVSHRMKEIFQISNRITVFRDGKYIGTKSTSDINYEELVGMMVGREFANVYPPINSVLGEEILIVSDLNRGRQVRDINFSLYQGEILGFYGLMGSGRSEIMRIILGVDKAESGNIWLEGKNITNEKVKNIIKKGIILAPEDRKQQGLVLLQGIRYNISLSVLDQIIYGVHVDNQKEDNIVYRYMNMLSIKAAGQEQVARTLSGGNQQKVVLSKCLAIEPKVLILDEPTRGIDIGTKHQIYSLIAELAEKGIAIILVSSELPEIIHLSTRAMIMCGGRISGELDRSKLTEERALNLALGGDYAAEN